MIFFNLFFYLHFKIHYDSLTGNDGEKRVQLTLGLRKSSRGLERVESRISWEGELMGLGTHCIRRSKG